MDEYTKIVKELKECREYVKECNERIEMTGEDMILIDFKIEKLKDKLAERQIRIDE